MIEMPPYRILAHRATLGTRCHFISVDAHLRRAHDQRSCAYLAGIGERYWQGGTLLREQARAGILVLVKSGELRVAGATGAVTLAAGDVYLLPPGILTSLAVMSGQQAHFRQLEIRGRVASAYLHGNDLLFEMPYRLRETEGVEAAWLRLLLHHRAIVAGGLDPALHLPRLNAFLRCLQETVAPQRPAPGLPALPPLRCATPI